MAGVADTGLVELFVAVDSVNGSCPELAAAWRKTSPRLPELSPERVRTKASAAATTTAVVSVATRGTDLHHGRCGSPPRLPPPGGREGGSEGGPEGGPEGPDRGPEGGPVGRPDDGGSTLTRSSPRCGKRHS
ncbi:hypothetical protein GCM10011578_093100 [Streptomyces fuscichromogenes]|uniref:Uncharacterized protein n=1 Tax=Streptomyces fuscichromogenes TaxID=1324013 RepID=A0A917XP81_9ACTN|nr:hypothetical protein GCM10011578_093100 [Streptomyces fuscichromogenes]